MFILESREQMEKAIERARELHPKVRMIVFGQYAVTGSKGHTYTVRCERRDGRKVVACSCATRDGLACKHSAAALSLHIALAARRSH